MLGMDMAATRRYDMSWRRRTGGKRLTGTEDGGVAIALVLTHSVASGRRSGVVSAACCDAAGVGISTRLMASRTMEFEEEIGSTHVRGRVYDLAD